LSSNQSFQNLVNRSHRIISGRLRRNHLSERLEVMRRFVTMRFGRTVFIEETEPNWPDYGAVESDSRGSEETDASLCAGSRSTQNEPESREA
jgi:hypothetical protein